jgi:hypothetical protein
MIQILFDALFGHFPFEKKFKKRIHFYFLKFHYKKQASRLIKNLPVPVGILVRKRVHLKLAA